MDMIKKEAQRIRGEMKGAMIFGQPICSDDVDALIVGAYYMAQKKEMDRHIKEQNKRMDMLFSNIRKKK